LQRPGRAAELVETSAPSHLGSLLDRRKVTPTLAAAEEGRWQHDARVTLPSHTSFLDPSLAERRGVVQAWQRAVGLDPGLRDAEAVLEALKVAEPASRWLSPLRGFVALARSRPLDALEQTRSVLDDPEAEAFRSATHGLSLLLEQPGELVVYLASPGRPQRPGVFLARYGAHLAAHPALEQAVASLEPGVKSDVWISKVRLGLAQLNGNRSEKRVLLEALARSEPNEPDWTVGLARMDLEERRYEQCFALLEKAFADRPMPYPAALIAGQALERAKRCDDSVAILEPYLRSDPTHRSARTSLAHCYARQGRSEDAEKAYRATLAMKPDESAAAMGLLKLLRSEGRAAEARKLLEGFQHAKARSDARARVERSLRIAKAAFGRKSWSEAILHARRALDIEPDLAEGHAIVGAASLRAGDIQTGREAFERVLVLDPTHNSARAYLARVLETEGNYTGAVALLEEHMDLHPSHVPALFALCSLYQRGGALAKAEDRIRAALALKPNNEALLVMLREALAGLGRRAEALEVALRIVASHPDSTKHWSRVESLARRAGDQAALARARAKLTDGRQ